MIKKENLTIQRAFKGISIIFAFKILSKITHIILNLLVVKKSDPKIFGLNIFIRTLTLIQTSFNKKVVKKVVSKRLGKNNMKIKNIDLIDLNIEKSSQNTVNFI